MEPVDRSPPGGEPLGKPPRHPKAPLPGVSHKARAICEEIFSSDLSPSESIHYASELSKHWSDLRRSGEIPSSMVKQFQKTLNKLKSVFETTLIPEELQELSEEVDLNRFR